MTVEVAVDDPEVVVTVRGDIDMSNSDDLRACLEHYVIAGYTRIIVDMSGVTFTDSTGLRAIVLTAMDLDGVGQLTVRKPSPFIERLIQLSGLQQILPVEVADSDVP